MIYFWWNVWKERNRRTLQNKSMQPSQAKPSSDALQGRFTAVSVGNKAQCGNVAAVILVLFLVINGSCFGWFLSLGSFILPGAAL